MKEHLNEFHSLPGVKGGKLRGPFRKSVTAILDGLSKHRAATDAGDHGCVMVWIDDAGKYRAAFMVYQHTEDGGTFETKADLRAWLKIWHSRCKEPHP